MTEKDKENDKGKETESAEGEPDEAAKAELKKKARKKLIILLAGLLVMTLIGAGIFLSGVFSKDVPEGEDATHAEGEAGEHPAEGEGVPPADKKLYMNIGEFLVNLNSSGKQASFLKMSVTLEVMGEANSKAVEENLPRIKDTFQTYLRELRAEDLKGSAGVYRLREALLLRVNKVLHPAQVSDILFEELIVQ